MRVSPLPIPSPDAIRQRIARRTHLLSVATDAQFIEITYLFRQGEFLAQLLHAARECLETACPPVPPLPEPMTLALWEQGLILPEEITQGAVTATVRWYVDQLREQRTEPLTMRFARDLVHLFGELHLQDDGRDDSSILTFSS